MRLNKLFGRFLSPRTFLILYALIVIVIIYKLIFI